MSEITTWIKEELYPAVYEVADQIFTEFDFKQHRGDWKSPLKIDLSTPKQKRLDKTVITRKAPGVILEQGGEAISLIDYVIKRDGVEFQGAIKHLSDRVGLKLPGATSFDPEIFRKQREQLSILEVANNYFQWCLSSAPGSQAGDHRAYLNKRGYSAEEIKTMGLGYIPSEKHITDYLVNKGYSVNIVTEALNISKDSRIGESHRLTIPYYSGGILKGFKFRTLDDGVTPKYLNSAGLDRVGGFFNISPLKGDKDLIVVEGELDALHATVKGIDNVVATGGLSISPEQIKDAVRKGAKKITLCFDTEADQSKTESAVKRAIEVIRECSDLKIYVASLPGQEGSKVDADSYIRDAGIEAFKSVLNNAPAYYEYSQGLILNRYGKIQEERGLTPKDRDNLIDEIVLFGKGIKNPIDRDLYTKAFISHPGIQALEITKESLNGALDRLRYKEDKEAQEREFKKLLDQASTLHSKGDTTAAIDTLKSSLSSIEAKVGSELIRHYSFSDWETDIAKASPAIKTGYPSLDKIIRIPQGAITLVAGRPSHGKTTLMYNLLIKMSQEASNRGKKFYFFSYEEESKYILAKILNSLISQDFSGYYHEYDVETNYNFLKSYLSNRKTIIPAIEEGKNLLKQLMDSGKIEVVGRGYSVEELGTLLTYLNKTENIGAVFIDYIQRMRTDRKTQDKRTEIAHISDRVLDIAKSTGLPIILGAQLNRGAAGAGRPTLEGLKEAGNLEEDANLVLSVYNESREKDTDESGRSYGREVSLEVKALKNRDGEPNQFATLTFDRWTGVIKEVEYAYTF